MYVFENWWKNLSHTKMQHNYSKKIFTRMVKSIRLTSFRISRIYFVLKIYKCGLGPDNTSWRAAG
jgi:hypothetical protein